MSTTVLNPTPFQTSYETQQLKERLKQLVENEDYTVIPYAELSALAGGDVQNEQYGKLFAARRVCEKETGRLFGVVNGIGVKLLEVTEQVGMANDQLGRFKRASRRSRERLGRVQLDRLTDIDRRQVIMTYSFVNTIAAFSSPSRLKRIDDAIAAAGTGKPLELGETLKLFVK